MFFKESSPIGLNLFKRMKRKTGIVKSETFVLKERKIAQSKNKIVAIEVSKIKVKSKKGIRE